MTLFAYDSSGRITPAVESLFDLTTAGLGTALDIPAIVEGKVLAALNVNRSSVSFVVNAVEIERSNTWINEAKARPLNCLALPRSLLVSGSSVRALYHGLPAEYAMIRARLPAMRWAWCQFPAFRLALERLYRLGQKLHKGRHVDAWKIASCGVNDNWYGFSSKALAMFATLSPVAYCGILPELYPPEYAEALRRLYVVIRPVLRKKQPGSTRKPGHSWEELQSVDCLSFGQETEPQVDQSQQETELDTGHTHPSLQG